jgi:uncharacterized coiled-coil DUF342 family protein
MPPQQPAAEWHRGNGAQQFGGDAGGHGQQASPARAASSPGQEEHSAAAPGGSGNDLVDALESLRAARSEHERLASEVRQLRDDHAHPAKISRDGVRRPAAEQRTGGGGEVRRLRTHIAELSGLLSSGEAVAKETTQRVTQHVSSVKKEVAMVRTEIDRLAECVDVAESRCTDAAEVVSNLRQHLRTVTTERDEMSTRLATLLSNTRASFKELHADTDRHDRELTRLNEQNSFLRLQLVDRR